MLTVPMNRLDSGGEFLQALPTLVRMCKKERTPEERAHGAETLAYLAEVDTELQRIASISDHLIPTLAELLKYQPPTAVVLYKGPVPSCTVRKIIETDSLMEHVVSSLSDSNPRVRLAAVRCLHSLSRSVQQLRTSFQDHAVWRPLMRLLHNASDDILLVASSTLCNLLLEFSPSKEQAMSRKRKALSFKEELDILRKVDEDPKRKRAELAKELGLATSTLSTIVGQRDTIIKNVLSFSVNAKQAKTAQHVKLEKSLLTWFKEVSAAGVNIDGKVLHEKADEITLALHIDGFQASGGWLHRFKTRHGLVYKSVCGEAKKADEIVVSDWLAKLEIPEGVPQALSESEEPIEGWECLDDGCSVDDFCTADDNLATCGACTVQDIVNEATCEVTDSSDDDEEMDVCDGEGPSPAAETLPRSTS
ncbi:hypothetical protein HPB51_021028 [Rhipicephalus microplus]|uniref:HTH CENPB-type domain-containing protein n=1 Tax=Rhipicephalus microplus TaxID=6941 RepID=A0A9J6DCJ5_RHIMP|nr:hypothetical protein HPB51_021028 [Rhipicephalus microplus]